MIPSPDLFWSHITTTKNIKGITKCIKPTFHLFGKELVVKDSRWPSADVQNIFTLLTPSKMTSQVSFSISLSLLHTTSPLFSLFFSYFLLSILQWQVHFLLCSVYFWYIPKVTLYPSVVVKKKETMFVKILNLHPKITSSDICRNRGKVLWERKKRNTNVTKRYITYYVI